MSYPSRSKRTHRVAGLAAAGIGATAAERGFVCGRLLRLSAHSLVIADESGAAELRLACEPEGVDPGDLVEISFTRDAQGGCAAPRCAAAGIRLMAKATQPPWGNRDFQRFTDDLKDVLRLRARLIECVRRFFAEADFLEVETPALVPSPGLELHLRSFATDYVPERDDPNAPGPRRVFLPTSPEYHMKRLLACGFERIFQICRCFRNGESYRLHNPEFTMLEWYRAWADYTAIMDDLESLGSRLGSQVDTRVGEWASGGAGEKKDTKTRGREDARMKKPAVDLSPPWNRITVADAFHSYAGIELPPETNADAFRRAARRAGFDTVSHSDTWDDVFYKVFLSAIEPKLGLTKPVFLTDYPASMAALAKRSEDDPSVAERFELFIGGVEIANGFTELNDPAEQRRRFAEELEQRRQLGAPEHPIDDRLLDALAIGMPPAGGVAVGLDRLIMLLAGKDRIADVNAFPFAHDFPAV